MALVTVEGRAERGRAAAALRGWGDARSWCGPLLVSCHPRVLVPVSVTSVVREHRTLPAYTSSGAVACACLPLVLSAPLRPYVYAVLLCGAVGEAWRLSCVVRVVGAVSVSAAGWLHWWEASCVCVVVMSAVADGVHSDAVGAPAVAAVPMSPMDGVVCICG